MRRRFAPRPLRARAEMINHSYMLRRYERVALLWAILATALAPSTVRAAYPEVGGPPAAASSGVLSAKATPASPPSVVARRRAVAPTVAAAVGRRASGARTPTPASRSLRGPAPRLYVLHHALLR